MKTNKHSIWDFVSFNQKRFQALANKVWSTPETCYTEQLSMRAHVEELIKHEFSRIERSNKNQSNIDQKMKPR